MQSGNEKSIDYLLDDDAIFRQEFCTPLTLERLEGLPVGALRITVKRLAELLPRCSFTTPAVWTPTTAPMPVLVIGRLDKGGKVLAPRIVLAVMDGQLRLVAEDEDVDAARCPNKNWEAWQVTRRGQTRGRAGFKAHKVALVDLSGNELNFADDVLEFLQWFGRRSFVVKQAGGEAGSEPRVSWPKRISEQSRTSRIRQTASSAFEGGLTPPFHADISAIPMTLEEAYSILPIGHTLKAAADTVLSKAAASSPLQEAERQAAQRYLRAFQLLASEFGLLPKAGELDAIERDHAALSLRIAALSKKLNES